MTTRSSMRVNPCVVRRASLVCGDTKHLLHRGELRLHFDPAIVPHQLHAFAFGQLAQLREGLSRGDRAIDVLGDNEQLEDADATEVATAPAGIAAASPNQLRPALGLV